MNYLRGAVSAISVPYQYYRDLNPSTLTGAIDVIVISRPKVTEQDPSDASSNDKPNTTTTPSPDDDKELVCSPFHVRFGKWQVLRPADKKVNVFVNGNLVPFQMKIGDAGEAFFVFETDEDVPEELVTSPLLEATKPGESNAQVQPPPTGRFGAKEDPEHVEDTQSPLESSQEPDFLDLNAGISDENSVKESLSSTLPNASGISLSKPSPSQVSHEDNEQDGESTSLLGRTAQLGKAVIEAVQEVGKSEKDKLKDKNLKDVLVEAEREESNIFKDGIQAAVNSSIPSIPPFGEDKGDEALPKVSPDAAKPPEVVYTHDVVFDMEGYHSHSRDTSDRTVTSVTATSQSPSGSHSGSDRTPGPSRTPSPGLSPSSSYGAGIPFPIRATSEPPPDFLEHNVGLPTPPSSVSPGHRSFTPHHTPSLGGAGTSSSALKLDIPPETEEEYSWEWGSFPQKTPVRAAFNLGKYGTIGFGKGKARMVDEEAGGEDVSDYYPTSNRAGARSRPKSKLSQPIVEGVSTDNPTFGSGGLLTVDRRDPTKFRVFIENRTAEFELSIIPRHYYDDRDARSDSGGFMDRDDEVEDARRFDLGKIDFKRFLEDESILHNEDLVLRWAGVQYVTPKDGSPLIEAISLWRDGALRSKTAQLSSSRPVSPSPPPDRSRRAQSMDFEQSSPIDEQDEEGGSDSRPLQPVKKPTSSSWARWWSRSRRETEAPRPELRPTDSAPPAISAPDDILQPVIPPKSSDSEPNLHVVLETRGRSTQTSPVAASQRPDEVTKKPRKRYAKTLRLTSEQLKSLNLKSGANTITFSLSTTGVAACTARLFVWDSADHIVVSDIDGTITKSDALGHVFTMIGRDWTHLGVAKLYTDICRNGYKIMYLTSRAIGQADSTRDYLKGIKQNDYQLPEGPVIMSPDRLMASLHREVIMRKPEVFKMACLRDIQRLFGPSSRYPFYAGFGNRITDALSYRSVNIPSSKIFTIDSTGEVKMELLELAGYKSSYIHMTDLVDQMFPPIHRKWEAEYTDFNYWKTPVQDFPLPDFRPPSPALSARSDTSNQSALSRLRNFSLVSGRQSTNGKQFTLPPPATETGNNSPADEERRRERHLRQMSSFERISQTLASFTSSSVATSPRSASPTFFESESDEEEEEAADVEKGRHRRRRTRSITSMPGSLPGSNVSDDEMQFDMEDEEDEHDEGDEEYGYEGENEGAQEEAYYEDILAAGEMENVPFL